MYRRMVVKGVLKRFVFLSVFLLLADVWVPGTVQGKEDKLTFGASIRFRYEYQEDFNQLFYGENPAKGSDTDSFLLGRFRAGLNYRPCKKIHMALWMQDSEVWDIALSDDAFYKSNFDLEHNPNKDRWELWDTFLEVKDIFDLPVSLKAGRQRIFYGNKRIFGPGQWGNTGRWIWDAAKISYTFKTGFVDGYYGKTQLHEPNEFSLNHRHGFESAGFYSHFKLPDTLLNLVVEPFFMTKTDDHDRYKGEDSIKGDLDSYYAGVRLCRKDLKGFDYDLTFITQSGDFAEDDISAYGFHILFGYNFKKISMTPRVSVEYSYGSGDSDPDDGDHETFDGAFGARDKMYGRMNLFHWKNIEDAQINLEFKPHNWIYFKASFHKFWLAEKEDAWYLNAKAYRDKTGSSGDEVGRELNFRTVIDISKKNQLQMGVGHFWPDEFAKNVASHKEANWAFCQWTYKFSHKIF